VQPQHLQAFEHRATDFDGSPLVAWGNPVVARRGAALEYAIELANTAGKDMWINVPAMADDGYVLEMAKLLKNTLDQRRKVYIEYSNEVWNEDSRFRQNYQNRRLAVTEWLRGDLSLNDGKACTPAAGTTTEQILSRFLEVRLAQIFTDERAVRSPAVATFSTVCGVETRALGDRRVAKRLLAIGDAFRSVFGEEAMVRRVRPVLASQVAAPSRVERSLKYVQKYGSRPLPQLVYGIAGAPYVNSDGFEHMPETSQTLASLFSVLEKNTDNYWRFFAPVSVVPYNGGNVSDRRGAKTSFQDLARHFGVRNFSYEGAIELNYPRNLARLRGLYFDAQDDERMQAAVRRYLLKWFDCGNGLFMYFNLSGAWGQQWGNWGLTNDLTKFTRKTDAVRDVHRSGVAGFSAPKCLPPTARRPMMKMIREGSPGSSKRSTRLRAGSR
jgi:hypothetical protein